MKKQAAPNVASHHLQPGPAQHLNSQHKSSGAPVPGTLIEDPPCLHPLTLKKPRARPSPSSSPARQSGQESLYPSLLDFPSSGSFCSYDLAPSSHPSWTVNPVTVTPNSQS